MPVFSVTTEGEEAITTAAETLVQLRGATTGRGRVVKWGVFFDGINAAAPPVQVELARQTTDGTGSAATEVEWDEDDGAAGITAFHSFSAEPTKGAVLEHLEIHPQGGGVIVEYPPGREPIVAAATTSRLGVIVTAGEAVNAVAFIVWEE